MDAAHNATDKRLDEIEPKLTEIYRNADKEIRRDWDDYMAKAAEEISALQKDYDAAKASGDKKLINQTGRKLAKAEREKTLTNARYKSMVQRTAEELTHVNEIATAYINGQLPDVYALNYNFISKKMTGAVKGYAFNLYDAHTVRNLAISDKTLLPYKVVNRAKDVRWNTKIINSQVLQGIVNGESIPKIAARLANVQNMTQKAAIRNARTMVTSAENKGRMDMMDDADDMGIIVKKRWIATHDTRTRDWHSELDGQTQDKDKPFVNSVGKIMYPGDPAADPANCYNCRCTLGYEITGFRSTLTSEQRKGYTVK